MGDHGMDVLAVARREALLTEVAKHPNVRVCVADVGTLDGWEKVRAAVGDTPLHVLVHNAGVNITGSLVEGSRESFQTMLRVNLEAPIFLTQALLPNLHAADGSARILIVGSGAGDMQIPSM